MTPGIGGDNSTGAIAMATGNWSTVRVSPKVPLVPVAGSNKNATLPLPCVVALPGSVLAIPAVAVSELIPTPAGAKQGPQSGKVVGGVKTPSTPASSTTVTLLLPLFATTANPSRAITETPSGLDPTETVEPDKIGAPVSKFKIDTVLSALFVTTSDR